MWHIKYNPDTRDHSRANYRGVDRWVAENQGKHFCQCGCGGIITVKLYMHSPSHAISKYLGHHYLKTREYLVTQTERAKKRVGEKAHHGKGGVTNKQEILRKSTQYVPWRTAVFQRG